MKHVACLAVLGAFAVIAPAQGTIVGSEHDFSTASWNQGAGSKQNEVCGVCHIPHVEGRPSSRFNSVLWGRELSSATYVMYFSYSMQGIQDPQPTGSTRLCLGCHDGSVALELFHTRTSGSTTISAGYRVPGRPGFDFRSDHPISLTYADGPTGDPGLRPRTTAWNGAVPGQTIADVLEGGKVQCVTCHDPHNVEVPTGVEKFLRIDINNPAAPSALCLACHIK